MEINQQIRQRILFTKVMTFFLPFLEKSKIANISKFLYILSVKIEEKVFYLHWTEIEYYEKIY